MQVIESVEMLLEQTHQISHIPWRQGDDVIAVGRVIGGSGDGMRMRRRGVAVSPLLSLSSALLPPQPLSVRHNIYRMCMYMYVYIVDVYMCTYVDGSKIRSTCNNTHKPNIKSN